MNTGTIMCRCNRFFSVAMQNWSHPFQLSYMCIFLPHSTHSVRTICTEMHVCMHSLGERKPKEKLNTSVLVHGTLKQTYIAAVGSLFLQ